GVHRFAAWQDRKALCLDELALLVEQGVQDAGLDRVRVFAQVDEGGIAPLVAAARLELVGPEGQARGRQEPVQGSGGLRYRPPAAVDQIPQELRELGIVAPAMPACSEQLRSEAAQYAFDERRRLFHDAQCFGLRLGDGGARSL